MMNPQFLLQESSHKGIEKSRPTGPLDPSSAHLEWHNRYNLVHVVRTRFMQFQPKLVHLARARLNLFRVFCLPLIRDRKGDDDSFLWTIRVDPDLDQETMSELLGLLQDNKDVASPRIIVIASNENPHFVHEEPSLETLLWGSLELWQSYYDAAMRNITVLETRLDADDGLSGAFVREIQQHVHRNPPAAGVPRVYCVRTHLEWEQEPLQSSLADSGTEGVLLGLRTRICVTPGLTYVYPPGSLFNGAADRLPAKHHHIHHTLPRCSDSVKEACLVRLTGPGDVPLAIRARSITSAGMMRVVHGNIPKTARSPELQENAWHYLMPQFGLTRDSVRAVKMYLEGPEKNSIVKEALEGQCTAGHSCKTGSKLALEELLRLASAANETAA